MKKTALHLMTVLLMLVPASVLHAGAQAPDGFFTVEGSVRDSRTRRPVENAVVTLQGTYLTVVTNADGVFSLKIPARQEAETLVISHMGYVSSVYSLGNGRHDDVTVYLTPATYPIKEIVVRMDDPEKIVKEAVARIGDNYSGGNNLLTAFYRETVRKKNTYIDISEAVASIYKTPYPGDLAGDMVELHKGRRLVSPKTSDTLAVKLMGGMNLAVQLDFVKNHDVLFSDMQKGYYSFTLGDPELINDRPHYVVGFSPRFSLEYPLYRGKLFIDQETLTFSRAEFSTMMDDKQKVTNQILRRKPAGLRFEPEEISYLITYKESGGKALLNYVRWDLSFKCDWKRRLFSSRYFVVSEAVMTDAEKVDRNPIGRHNALNPSTVLSDRVGDFYDFDFWEDYNIIEPTESLESAVNRLLRKHR